MTETRWTCDAQSKATWLTSADGRVLRLLEHEGNLRSTNCTAEPARQPPFQDILRSVSTLVVNYWPETTFTRRRLPGMLKLTNLSITVQDTSTTLELCAVEKLQQRRKIRVYELHPLGTADVQCPTDATDERDREDNTDPVGRANDASTVVGLAVGFSTLGLLIVVAILFVRRRRRTSPKDDANPYHEVHDRTLIAGGSHETIVRDPVPCSKLTDHPALKAHWRADLVNTKTTAMRGSHDMLWCRDASGAKLALKSLDLTSEVQTTFLAGFQRIASLQHDQLGRILGVSVVNYDAALVLVTPYCEKGALSSVLHAVQVELDSAALLSISRHVALGLQYLHAKGCVYGRVSSHKVLLDAHWNASLNIFALLSPLHAHAHAPFGAFALAASAPELLLDQSGPSPASDVYALGMLLGQVFLRVRPYAAQQHDLGLVGADLELVRQLQTGRRPPFPFDEKALVAATSATFVALVKACLHPNPGQRPTIDDVVARLRL